MGTSRHRAIPSSCSAELPAPPAVPPARPCRRSRPGQCHRRAIRALDCEHGSSGARGVAAPGSRRDGPLRSPLAFARWPQSSRRRSEDDVRRALAPLEAEGWRLRHSLPWQGQGDIDSVAIAPTGIAVAIETKTRTYDQRHLARVREQVAWLSRRRRRWARNGALGVMCLVRARGVERVEHDVLIVSIDRLPHVLRDAAGMRLEPPSFG
ncbi:MAG: nuclease-related domain-containing protein [Solirubrobacteraceae bacterium]